MTEFKFPAKAAASGLRDVALGKADTAATPLRWVIVTPSYAPDIERCKVLCRSIDICVSAGVQHIIVVDRRDRTAFASLESNRRKILDVESMLPWSIRRLPLARRWWLNLRGRPIRNWMLQQLVKIQCAATVEADAVLFLDSDVLFVRPFSPHSLEQEGKVAISRVPFTSAEHARWLRNAASVLGIPTGSHGVNYVGNLISWRSDVARALIDHLTHIRERHWMSEFTSQWHMSEYMVYGTFVEHILGIQAAGHFPAAMPLIHLSWDYDLTSDSGMQEFFGALSPEHVAIMVHSKDNIEVNRYMPFVEALWKNVVGIAPGN